MEMVPQLLKYDLTSEVTAFSTTRHGGCSEGNYSIVVTPWNTPVATKRRWLKNWVPVRSASSFPTRHTA